MFSEKQLASIVAEVLDKDENIEWASNVSEYLNISELSEGVLGLYLDGNMAVDGQLILYTGFSGVINENDDTLQDILDVKQENPTDLTDIPETFAENPTGNQLPNADKSNLTADEVERIKEKMLELIKRGYIKMAGTIYKISCYTITDTTIDFNAGYFQYASGVIDAYSTFHAKLFISNSEYVYETDEL